MLVTLFCICHNSIIQKTVVNWKEGKSVAITTCKWSFLSWYRYMYYSTLYKTNPNFIHVYLNIRLTV